MKRQRLFLLVGVLVSSMKMMAQPLEYENVWCADKGNGTYVNPVINGDFPDIDVVRVDDTYSWCHHLEVERLGELGVLCEPIGEGAQQRCLQSP